MVLLKKIIGERSSAPSIKRQQRNDIWIVSGCQSWQTNCNQSHFSFLSSLTSQKNTEALKASYCVTLQAVASGHFGQSRFSQESQLRLQNRPPRHQKIYTALLWILQVPSHKKNNASGVGEICYRCTSQKWGTEWMSRIPSRRPHRAKAHYFDRACTPKWNATHALHLVIQYFWKRKKKTRKLNDPKKRGTTGQKKGESEAVFRERNTACFTEDQVFLWKQRRK